MSDQVLRLEQWTEIDGRIVVRLLAGEAEVARRDLVGSRDDMRVMKNAAMFMRHHDRAVELEIPEAAATEFSLACEQLFGEEVRPWLPA